MALEPRGQLEQCLAVERSSGERITGDETPQPSGRTRSEPARQRSAVHAPERAAVEGAPQGLVGGADAASDDIAVTRSESAGALSLDAHDDRVELLGGHLVVERERQAERVEAGPEVGRAGGNADAHAGHGPAIVRGRCYSRLSSHSGVSEMAQLFRTT